VYVSVMWRILYMYLLRGVVCVCICYVA